MPRLYEFTEADFFDFTEKMVRIGFRRIEPYEFYAELKVANVIAPTPRFGREEGFIFNALGLEVRVWTSFIMATGGIRKPDSGWVVIREHGEAKYFAPQMRRTKNFFKRLLDWAQVCKEHILARPLCPSGTSYMTIFRKENTERKTVQIFWKGEGVTRQWDIGLSEKSLKLVTSKRKKRQKYNKQRKKQNKPPHGTARQNRKKWRKKEAPPAHAH